jgi:hypothetical protein
MQWVKMIHSPRAILRMEREKWNGGQYGNYHNSKETSRFLDKEMLTRIVF